MTRREFISVAGRGLAVAATGAQVTDLWGQSAGTRPSRSEDVRVLNPRCRVPVGLIIDDSTCLVNLNRFAMPQFDEAYGGKNQVYKKPWRDWPVEIPDAFVRKFGEWSAEHGVKGKFSIVPYPALVGRLDLGLPGWSRKELKDSLDLIREVMMPNWDIHPEMITHTRVLNLKTGQPFPEWSLKFMENWEWTTGKSVAELADYMAYALRILKEAGLGCEGITTPGGFGNRVLPELAQASMQSLRDVFSAEVPHYFRHLFDAGAESVAPRVEYASDWQTVDPKCVVSIIGCTGDWTGGWDCTTPAGPDRFITRDLQKGRMVEVIGRGEPAIMVCHWTGIYWNGQELGFKIFQEVVRRLHERYDNLVWMKLAEVSRYWAAKELTAIKREENEIVLAAPFACAAFTLECRTDRGVPALIQAGGASPFKEVARQKDLQAGTWLRADGRTILCFDLPKGRSRIRTA